MVRRARTGYPCRACLANCAVAEGFLGGFEFYHFLRVKLHYGCGTTWTRINIDLLGKKRNSRALLGMSMYFPAAARDTVDGLETLGEPELG